MNEVQLLRRLLEVAGITADGPYVLALAGDGIETVPETIEVAGVRLPVARPTSELGLRRAVNRANGAPFLAILPEDLARRLPPDLLRAARGARVHALDPTEVLSVVLGTHVISVHDGATQQLALDRLPQLRALLDEAAPPTAVDARLLDELLAEVMLGQRLRHIAPGQLLALLLRAADGWSDTERAVWQRHLPRQLANEGRVVAWALGAPGRLRSLVVRGALFEIDDDPAPAVWGELAALLGDPDVGLPAPVLRATVARLALDTLAALAEDARPLLEEASSAARQLFKPAQIASSTVLPLGLVTRCEALAKQAAAGQPIAAADLERLKEHLAASLYAREIDVIAELARLSRYLATPTAPPTSVPGAVTAYQESGSFADLAAARLRQRLASTSGFHAQAAAVLRQWRDRRDRENLAFAQRLAGGYEKAIHDPAVIPVHRIWKALVLPRIEAGTSVFVVVMDGCSYPVFLQLLGELGREPSGPIGLAYGDGAGAAARGLPGLALLPSVTSHSRSAIFQGEIPKDPWVDESQWRGAREAASDPARFNANLALGQRPRRLFLKGQMTDGGAALQATLADPAVPVVAAVFNAIDDQIGSSNTGAPLDVRMDHIAGFLPAIRAAHRAGRAVLLLADHGHTPFDSTDQRVGAGATPRYVALGPGEEPPDGFIEIDMAGLGGAGDRQAFAWRMSCYRGMPQVGFHGGCSLEELVVPMAWLVADGVPADEPPWWYGGRVAAGGPAPGASAVGSRAALPPAEPAAARQPQLPTLAPAAGPAAPAAATAPPPPAGVDDEIWASLDVRQQTALACIARDRVVGASELAAAVSVPVGRVTGMMTLLERHLHGRGLRLFVTEERAGGERQYVYVSPEGR